MNYPIVYDRFETNFSTLGLAVLDEATGVKIKSVVNGELTLSMIYPRNGAKWPHLAADNFVQVRGQLFRIRGLEEQRDSSGKLASNIQCEHVWYDAGNCKFIPLFEMVGATPTAILEAAFANTRFVVGSVDSSFANTDIVMSKTNPAAIVNQLIELVGGELVRDNWTIGLAVRCGSDLGVEFRTGKNLGTVKRTTDAKAIVTRLYPYGADDLDITTVNSGAAFLNSAYISNYDYIHSGSIDYGDIEDPTELKARGLEEFSTSERDGIDKPKVTYQVDVVELAKLAGVRFESFGLGDTVRIVDSDLGIDVNARIMEYVWYPFEPKRSAVTLANFRENLANLIVALADSRAQVIRMTTPEGKVKAAWMENLRAKLQTEIEAGLSKRIVSHDYGDLWVDDLDAPTKAMVIVNGVFAIANSKKINGDWDWKTFGNGDGFTANLINAGKIRLSEGLTVENDDGTFIISSTGLVMKLADESARSVFAPDTIALQVKVAGEWVNAIWFDPVTKKYIIDGTLSVNVINAIKAQIDVVISNTVIINNLTAQKGYIAELTVDQIDTSDKVQRYLDGDTTICSYWRGYAPNIEFVEAQIVGSPATEQVHNRIGNNLYWTDITHTGVTEAVNAFPILQYVYTEAVKLKLFHEIDPITGYANPKMIWGAGNLSGKMKGYIYKDQDEMVLSYEASSGAMREIRLGEDGITMSPALLIFPDTFNAATVTATGATVLQGIDVIYRKTTKVAFDVQMDVTASEAMTLTVKARIAGVEHRRTVKYFSGAYKDGICFNGLFDAVPAGTKTIDITITPSSGTATIAVKDYRLMLTIRDGSSNEAAPWPEITITEALPSFMVSAPPVRTLASISANFIIAGQTDVTITFSEFVEGIAVLNPATITLGSLTETITTTLV